MKEVQLIRSESSEQGTFGALAGMGIWIAEPPDRGNLVGRSCIPAGEYLCHWQKSPRYGWCYQVCDVPGRTRILIHPGNLAGDKEKGLKTHTLGCLLPGKRLGRLTVRGKNQRAVLNSRTACHLIEREFNKDDFIININIH